MTDSQAVSRVQLCVELALESHQTALAQHRQLNEAALRLVRQLEQLELPATWAVDEVAESAVCDAVQANTVPHEIAIIGTNRWLGPEHAPSHSQSELQRRLQQSGERGLQIRSLVLHDVNVPKNLELLAQHEIGVIRRAVRPSAGLSEQATSKRSRFGIHQVQASHGLPLDARRFGGITSAMRTRQLIRKFSQAGSLYHLAIRVPRLLTTASRIVGDVDRTLHEIAKQRDAGNVQVETLRDMYRRLEAKLKSRPSCSILRRAA